MYKNLYLLIITIFIAFTACTKSVENTTWTGSDSDGKEVVLIFHNNNKASLKRYLGKNSKTTFFDYKYEHPILELKSMSDYNFIGLVEDKSITLTFSTSSAIVLDGEVLSKLTKSQ